MNRITISAALGALLLASCQDDNPNSGSAVPSPAAFKAEELVLAISWQPAFCERRGGKPECRSLAHGDRATQNFSLHGLWPQPRSEAYCGVSQRDREADKRGRWKNLPRLALSTRLREQLNQVMPGTQSYLHRHEWVKHGTCYTAEPEIYYQDSLLILDAINLSPVAALFRDNIGRRVSGNAIRAAFDQQFGQGAGARVRIACNRDGRRQLIGELTIGLRGRIDHTADIGALIRAAPKTNIGCPGGIVDPVGSQ